MYKLKCAYYQNLKHVYHSKTAAEWSSSVGTTFMCIDMNACEEACVIPTEI